MPQDNEESSSNSEPGSAEKKSKTEEVIIVDGEKNQDLDDVIVITDNSNPSLDIVEIQVHPSIKTKEVVNEAGQSIIVIADDDSDDELASKSVLEVTEKVNDFSSSDQILERYKREFPHIPQSVLQDKALDITLDINLNVQKVEEELRNISSKYQAQRVSVRTFTGKELPCEIDKESLEFIETTKTIFKQLCYKKRLTEIKNPDDAIESIKIIKNLNLEEKFAEKKEYLLTKEALGVDGNLEELILFHGTSEDSLRGIIKEGFQADAKPIVKETDVQKRYKGKVYGPGFYLTEYPSKGLHYGNALLVCKVLVGCCQTFKMEDPIAKLPIQYGYDSKKISHGNLDGWIYVIRESSQILPVGVITLKDKNITNSISRRRLQYQHDYLFPGLTKRRIRANLTCITCNRKCHDCVCIPAQQKGGTHGAPVPSLSSAPSATATTNQGSVTHQTNTNYARTIYAAPWTGAVHPFLGLGLQTLRPTDINGVLHKSALPVHPVAKPVPRKKPTEVQKLGPVQADYLRLTTARKRRHAISGPQHLKPSELPFPAKKCKVTLERVKVEPPWINNQDTKLVLGKSTTDASSSLHSLHVLNSQVKMTTEKNEEGVKKIPIVKSMASNSEDGHRSRRLSLWQRSPDAPHRLIKKEKNCDDVQISLRVNNDDISGVAS